MSKRNTRLVVVVVLAAILVSPVAAVAGPAREEGAADAPAATSLFARWLESLAGLFARGSMERVLGSASGSGETDAGPEHDPNGASREQDGGSHHDPNGASGEGEQDGGSHHDPDG